MGRPIGLTRGWADRVRNKHDDKIYSISTLKNDFWDFDFDFYETVVWQQKGLVDEPNEDNALLVANTGQKIPWFGRWLEWIENDLAARRHKEIVKIVETEPPENWVRKYAPVPIAEALRFLKIPTKGKDQSWDPLGRDLINSPLRPLVIIGNSCMREAKSRRRRSS